MILESYAEVDSNHGWKFPTPASAVQHSTQQLQSKQVKRTPQDSINELIIWKMNPLVVPVTGVKFKSELLHA